MKENLDNLLGDQVADENRLLSLNLANQKWEVLVNVVWPLRIH